MVKEEIGPVLENQRKFFATGRTLDIEYRLAKSQKTKIAYPEP